MNLPEELLAAQASGTLVVFAGAGVSVPPPSDLPLFSQLTDQVADRFSRPRKHKNEPEDYFLGRLDEEGLPVHRVVREIISRPSSKPNHIHTDLVRLFKNPEHLRLVTTNFDTHFTTASMEVFGEPVDHYFGPAVPLGRDFSGIVYVHSSVTRPHRELILTDSDFGRAYLTDRWATRFLVPMFQTYTVLFVGYSHRDVVMEYLARGLPPERPKQRFALDEAGNEADWERRRIVPITFPASANE
ncbi:MAG TPA: SIR2 family protein [Actinomycetota bacterium]|nr:SIR2 family protein [Actinomycetota bacterium]